MDYIWTPFVNCATRWGCLLSSLQIEQCATYAAELQMWNRQFNLTAITEISDIVVRHFIDSLRCVPSWGDVPHRLADVGSGAGFPGLVLKIAFPELRVTLIESVGKKARFLAHIVQVLGLEGVTIVALRAEDVGRDPKHREHYDVVTARGVAKLPILVEYCLPLLGMGGRLLAPKGPAVDDEVSSASHAISTLGGRMVAVESVDLPGIEPRTMVVIEKVAPTPACYPRDGGLPIRRPLL